MKETSIILPAYMPRKKYIDSIFNYCDTWYERCAFTSQCRLYRDLSSSDPEENDVRNKKFWESIQKSFQKTIDMIRKDAEERGIDLEAAMAELPDDYTQKKEKQLKDKFKHPFIKLTEKYRDTARDFLENKYGALVKQKQYEVIQKIELGIESIDSVNQSVVRANDCLEIIQRYLFLIQVKFMRALPDGDEDNFFKPGEEFYMYDNNGSAKLALVLCDRSLQAWQYLMTVLPECEDDIIVLMAILQKIIREGEVLMPDARNFKRPGFDE